MQGRRKEEIKSEEQAKRKREEKGRKRGKERVREERRVKIGRDGSEGGKTQLIYICRLFLLSRVYQFPAST